MDEERMRPPASRAPLPPHTTAPSTAFGMTHDELVDALRAAEGLRVASHDPPTFDFRGRPFLHFHAHPDGTYADVRFGTGDFEPVWASTPVERLELLARVLDHVERVDGSRKADRRRERPNRRR